jgi:murein DD-endopeptidase MepM/ murein hydrolase activator NlpD
MRKFKTFIGKLLITCLTLSLLIGLGSLSTSPTNASNTGLLQTRNSRLMIENMELKQQYEELVMKLEEMENLAIQVQEFDNAIYAQMLGVDYDTTGYYEFYNDTISFVLKSRDSIFSEVNDRAFYAAEMLATQLTKLQETSHLFQNNKNAINYYPTISPIKARDFINISSPYGFREHPIKKEVLFHEGIDISARVGTDVYSTAQGRVIKVLYSKYGYGNRVVIKHAYGFETLYAHLGVINVKKGQWVQKNQKIGTVGNTGLSTGPHLHYEIHKHKNPRDPLGYFYVSIGEELLAMN